MKLSRLLPDDFEHAVTFWRHAEGMGTAGFETSAVMRAFLKRNPSLSFKITDREEIVGTILCGHDGRRGYLHHLAIASNYSHRQVGTALINRTLQSLRRLGISRCHIFISAANKAGQDFWKSIDWNEQGDVTLFSHDIEFPST